MSKIYVAGPMTGKEQFNFPAFDKMRDELQELGHIVVSPADIDRLYGFDPANYEHVEPTPQWLSEHTTFTLVDAVRHDIDAIILCDWLVLLDGWENSRGAKGEKAVAEWLGKVIFYPGDPVPPSGKQLNPLRCCTK